MLFEGLWVELFDWTGDAILKIGDESCEDGRGVAIKQLDHTEGRHLVAGPHVFVGFVVVEMFAEEGAGGNAEGFDADGAPLLLFHFLRAPTLDGGQRHFHGLLTGQLENRAVDAKVVPGNQHLA